jgi:D-alanyl-D-alanine carboxypeptidase (penicillin-binding protein 5/6)
VCGRRRILRIAASVAGLLRPRRLAITTFAAGAAMLAWGVGDATAAGVPGPPGLVPASALLVYEPDTGQVVYAVNDDAELAIASTTKLMTAYVTLQLAGTDPYLTEQPYAAGPGESLAGVPPGTRLSVADMLRAMLLPSGNDVAHSLAVDVGGSVPRFVEEMNAWAGVLNLGRTHFTTPIGLDQPPGNHSTALDLARLATALLRDRLVAGIVREQRAVLSDGIVVENRNDLLAGNPWVVGVKTGYTLEAGYCLVGAARLHGVTVISVVLGAPSVAARDADSLALLRYGLSRFRLVRIARAGRVVATLPVKGRRGSVRLIAKRSASVVVGVAARIHAALVVPTRLVGPLAEGAVVGSIQVRENGRVLRSVPLVTARAVAAPPRPAHHRRAGNPLLWGAAGAGVGALLLGCSLPLMRRRSVRGALQVL